MKNPHKPVGENALANIKSKKIIPKSKWKCLLSSRLAWVFSFLFVLIGSLAFSVILYMILNNDWDLYKHLGDSLLEFVFATLPYFWIVVLLILGFLALYSSKFTEDGYRYKLATLIFIGLFLNIVFGGTFYALGMGELIDTRLQEDIPVYNYLSTNKEKMWTQPEKGVLSGEVISLEENNIAIKDYLGNVWDISLSSDILVKGRYQLRIGMKIKIIGKMIEDSSFLASEIRPWMGNGSGMMRMQGMQGYRMQ